MVIALSSERSEPLGQESGMPRHASRPGESNQWQPTRTSPRRRSQPRLVVVVGRHRRTVRLGVASYLRARRADSRERQATAAPCRGPQSISVPRPRSVRAAKRSRHSPETPAPPAEQRRGRVRARRCCPAERRSSGHSRSPTLPRCPGRTAGRGPAEGSSADPSTAAGGRSAPVDRRPREVAAWRQVPGGPRGRRAPPRPGPRAHAPTGRQAPGAPDTAVGATTGR
jgi:hypothetical protein